MSVTIRDVVEEASVSATTVSRVFNHDHLVNRETREHVLEVAQRMGYSPDATALSLSNGRTQLIGVTLPAPHGEFFSELIRGVDEATQEAGYFLLTASSHYNLNEGEFALKSLANRVDGLAMMTSGVRSDPLTEGIDLPVLFVNSDLRGDPFDVYNTKNREGATHAVQHLIEAGYSRIVAIIGPPGSYDVEQRMEGYRHAIEQHDGAEGPIIEGDFTQESGYEAGKKFLDSENLPDAVFACNDHMAMGALLAFQEAGIRIPEDIAVAGFDDITSVRYSNPPLTTVRAPLYELGRQVTKRLLQPVESRCPQDPKTFTGSHELNVRTSTKRKNP